MKFKTFWNGINFLSKIILINSRRNLVLASLLPALVARLHLLMLI